MNNETFSSIANQIIDETYEGTTELYTQFGALDILPDTSLRLCNSLAILLLAISTLPFIGTQGLIFVRTYALCQGYRPVTIALSATILAALFALSQHTTMYHIIIWGLWKLKRSLGLRSNKDFATLILQHAIFLTDVGVAIQDMLSTLLVCEFTLDLRRRNQQNSVPNQSALHLPTISFHENPVQSIQSALGRLHESIVAEMGERNDQVNVDEPNLEEQDHGLGGSCGAGLGTITDISLLKKQLT
ncbi:hypothetical protein Clacol_010349 [Clathrus columnatus]|uniref:Uncharacterized protein n=1 Tax=Clathrus columnatus TaxID=1419009 RepID=A0AAV5ATL1_9AGAM|nr:hypothetical protein Clacol_010349 [Clathrus columnatus]